MTVSPKSTIKFDPAANNNAELGRGGKRGTMKKTLAGVLALIGLCYWAQHHEFRRTYHVYDGEYTLVHKGLTSPACIDALSVTTVELGRRLKENFPDVKYCQ
jgi:hypothetical protein